MNDEAKLKFKNQLKEKALEILHKRIDHAFTAMNEAQNSANEEGKSSVGDKYETGRAMAQNDRDIYARQLESGQKELSFVMSVDVNLFCRKVDLGAFVETDSEKYFFLTGLGMVELVNEKVFFLSITSPIGKLFQGKQAGEKFIFNSKEISIKEVF